MGTAHQQADQTTLAQARAHFNAPTLDVEGLGETLDGMSAAQRLAWIRTLSRAEQMRLFEAAHGRTMTLEDLVPASVPTGQEVICEGFNTLPAFRMFQKRFCRVEGTEGLSGYNHQTMSGVTGPGYFVAFDDAEAGEVAIDYRQIPETGAPGWPEIIPNERKLGRFVYSGMVDRMRRVSTHVSVGRAFKDDRAEMNAWFMLCRMI